MFMSLFCQAYPRINKLKKQTLKQYLADHIVSVKTAMALFSSTNHGGFVSFNSLIFQTFSSLCLLIPTF